MRLFIVYDNSFNYLTSRRNTGKLYECRSGWSSDFKDAKVFNTKAAATNSARQAGGVDFTVTEGTFQPIMAELL